MSVVPKKHTGASKSLPLVIEQDEDGMFIVECPVLSGCYAQGESYDEAMTHIQEVIALALEDGDNKAILEAYSPINISFQTITI